MCMAAVVVAVVELAVYVGLTRQETRYLEPHLALAAAPAAKVHLAGY
jgi:hypothetical protein